MTGTTKDGSSLNVNIGDNLNTLKTAALNETLTHAMKNTGSWATNWKDQWGAFYLEEGKTYYLKITFLQVGTTWVGNVGEIGLTLSADQNQTPVNGVKPGADYVIYKHDFNSGTSYLPPKELYSCNKIPNIKLCPLPVGDPGQQGLILFCLFQAIFLPLWGFLS